ncbi:hypothetical protein [Actinacidiphila bryophytorum]|uniref:Uncharacterized protein n=1 Tax=Actinacidiphila bryophytorum TaxID=1436133 RepID=A0A9W4H3T9_9ACTN|nr:hypothetical protein [Actinacidiphila bryophytorum]MBM9439888.1 hypothetical protein [Actinacidiphila bryophytorum]MBN6542806.1 hypothetical protein [Actinacidiphila bryophytorum]CAG7648390.1 conserved hypothetical protein [Actinacidiphila bryophytorum]
MHDPAPPPPIPRPDLPPDPVKPGPPESYRHVGLVPAAGPARTWGLAVVGVPLLVLLLIGLAVGGSGGGSDSAAPHGSSVVLGADTSAGGAVADSSSGGDLLPTWTPQDLPGPATTAPEEDTPAPETTAPTDPAGGTDVTTDPAADQATDTASSTDTPTAYAGSQAVVAAYFDAINNRDYRTAWNLGGSNFAADYDSYVAGFSTTSSDAVTFRSVQGDVVQVYFDAWQTDGTADSYDATFTVSGGRITGGKVTPTS